MSYLFEQGVGQSRLRCNARANEDVLNDPKVSQDHKDKIKKILEYKSYFYNFFKVEEKSIYAKTTILKTKAVSHLVIVSPHNEVKAMPTCFWFMGCFPYLGFFNETSAIDYQHDKEKENFVTYKRPVYAYSTLGYLEDSILSSFFYYDELELSELIFHELFHTIFFAQGEVDFNEALASFISMEMSALYYKENPRILEKSKIEINFYNQMSETIAKSATILNERYKGLGESISKERSLKLLQEFVAKEFIPEVKQICQTHKMSDEQCYPLKINWNNASFAAFLTYEKSFPLFKIIKEKLNLDLFSFYLLVKDTYEHFKKEKYKGETLEDFFIRFHHIKKD